MSKLRHIPSSFQMVRFDFDIGARQLLLRPCAREIRTRICVQGTSLTSNRALGPAQLTAQMQWHRAHLHCLVNACVRFDLQS